MNFFIFLNILIITIASFLNYKKAGNLFNLGLFFNAYALLYFVVGPVIYHFDVNAGYSSEVLNQVTFLSTLALIGFNFSYFLNNKIAKNQVNYTYIPLG